MRKGMVRVIYGNGRGKTAAAIGRAITSAEQERKIIMIQFLKGNLTHCSAFLRRLEPEFRLFSFEKREQAFDTLLPEEKQEEIGNIQNGLNFAKKVMVTGECDIPILDEVLGLLDYGIISREEILALLGAKNEEMEVILTGRVFPEDMTDCADEIVRVENQKGGNS